MSTSTGTPAEGTRRHRGRSRVSNGSGFCRSEVPALISITSLMFPFEIEPKAFEAKRAFAPGFTQQLGLPVSDTFSKFASEM